MPTVTTPEMGPSSSGKTAYIKHLKVSKTSISTLFHAKLTILLDTPLGNFRREFIVDEATIEQIATWVAEIVLAAIT